MILHKEELLLTLDKKGMAYYLYEHPPIFTVEDAMQYWSDIPEARVKNLVLRNQKKTLYWLITVREKKRIDLPALGKIFNAGRLSFTSSHDLTILLGIQPGSVTPFAIINDQAKKVTLIVDKDLLEEKYISVHPMENTATISIELNKLVHFIQDEYQRKIEFVNIPGNYS